MEIICHSKFNVYQMWPDTIVVGDLNTPLSSVDRLSRLKKKINKDTLELNNTMKWT
jgi:hypothetical protein